MEKAIKTVLSDLVDIQEELVNYPELKDVSITELYKLILDRQMIEELEESNRWRSRLQEVVRARL